MTLPELLAEMEAGLEGTTRGPWATEAGLPYGVQPRIETADKLIAVVGNAERDVQDEWEANAAHIARCSPDNIAAIIASYREMEALIREAQATLEPFAEYLSDGFDLDDKGNPSPDDNQLGWVYLTLGDLRRARTVSSKIKKELPDAD